MRHNEIKKVGIITESDPPPLCAKRRTRRKKRVMEQAGRKLVPSAAELAAKEILAKGEGYGNI